MSNKIAMGFHTCVDYELIWDTEVVESLIEKFAIREDELLLDAPVHTERDAWIFCLAHLRAGIGGEIVPDDAQSVIDFAEHFERKETLGGTATRAAIVLDKLGYDTYLQTSCWNQHVENLLPEHITAIPGAEDDGRIYPHVVLQCGKGVRIHAGDIDFVTPRENRMMISRDETSLDMPVVPEAFGPVIEDADVFLLGCFSEILERKILDRVIGKTEELLKYLPKKAVVICEDGCYVIKAFRYAVHEHLRQYFDVLSMNEDEMQEYIGRSIDILDVKAVSAAVKSVYESIGLDHIIIHSAKWALAYGKHPEKLKDALIGGATMASTRFRLGDDITREHYEETANLPNRADSEVFCEAIREVLGDRICIIPSKDMSHVEHPAVVGLGDSFIGGCLPGLVGLKDSEEE